VREQLQKFEDSNVSHTISECLQARRALVFETVLPDRDTPYTAAGREEPDATRSLLRDTAAPQRAQLWRYREVATFERFERMFNNQSENAKSYPVLAAILKHERNLHLIKFAADVLEWQVCTLSVCRIYSNCVVCMHMCVHVYAVALRCLN
jgi:hypothetical protein